MYKKSLYKKKKKRVYIPASSIYLCRNISTTITTAAASNTVRDKWGSEMLHSTQTVGKEKFYISIHTGVKDIHFSCAFI